MTALGVEGISAFSVFRINKELDEKVKVLIKANRTRNTLFVYDATYLKVRDGLHYQNKALFIVAGVRNDGYREILGARLSDSEDSLFWQDLFEDLKERGLRGVKLIVSDGHKGSKKQLENPLLDQAYRCVTYIS